MSSKKKRVTVKYVSPNPLFEEWLTNWRDEAAEKGSKMQYCFSTALHSLKRYPIPLECGKECKILKGFGDKLCMMLDDKLKEHKSAENEVDNIIRNDGEDNVDEAPTTTSSKKRKSKAKSAEIFVPQQGSGGYAILITLLLKSQEANYKGYLGKAEIIEHARTLSNKSFTKPDPGTFYTAWSSMQTLISKGLVLKWSNPAKFKLTDHGLALAISLQEQAEFGGHTADCLSDVEKGDSGSKNQLTFDVPLSTDDDILMVDNYEPTDMEFPAGPSNHMSLNLLENAEHITETDADIFISKYPLDKPPNFHENNLNNVGDSITSPKTELDEEFLKIAAKYSKDNSSSNKVNVADKFNIPGPSKRNIPEINTYSISREPANSIDPSIKSSLANTQSITKPKLGKFLSESGNSKKPQNSLKSHKSDITDSANGAVESECFLMGPNSFDIILLVDNQENSDSKNEEIQNGLESQSIVYETRDLKVGDYAWICRCRHTKKELVLPYIVERKRMDDFGGSIKDGRYYEQKFRLKRSGIENLTYLVESYGKNSSVGLPLTSLYQAATNTALQDNFFIKFTNNIKETSNYLASFSKSLVKLYKNKTLVSCSRDDVTPVDLNDDLVSLMEFKQFNKSSTKNQKMKVTDMFVKVLIQIKGISVDKAMAIVEKYPTLTHLYQAYENTPNNRKEKLLSDIKYGKSGKTLGAVLSKTIFQLFTFDSY